MKAAIAYQNVLFLIDLASLLQDYHEFHEVMATPSPEYFVPALYSAHMHTLPSVVAYNMYLQKF